MPTKTKTNQTKQTTSKTTTTTTTNKTAIESPNNHHPPPSTIATPTPKKATMLTAFFTTTAAATPILLTLVKDIPLWILLPCLTILSFIVWLVVPATKGYYQLRKGEDNELKYGQNVRASMFNPSEVSNKDFDVIVIGSGSGGCACANTLSHVGYKVLVLEQHPTTTGGCTHSFRKQNCEWDTGLHYTAAAMGMRTNRPGALLEFMTKGLQKWTPLQDPYDEVVFPPDSVVSPQCPNSSRYEFVAGQTETVESILKGIDPTNAQLKQQIDMYMDLCDQITAGFTALGLSRMMPSWMVRWTGLQRKIDFLYKIASMTVRQVQYAIFNLGYTIDDLVQLAASKECPTPPDGPESDPTLRRLKAVLTHPIGDYAVQPAEATMAAHGVTMSHYKDGACYTEGPTQKISMRSLAVVRALGGEAFVDATVLSIMMNSSGTKAIGVRVANTSALHPNGGIEDNVEITEILAKKIVVATSVYNLYNKLLPQDLPVVREFQDPTKRTITQSNGHIFLFCKIRGDSRQLNLPTHNLWYFNGYDLDDAFAKYFKDPASVRPPTVYIGFPCTKDTTWPRRFPSTSNCILISDGLWEWFSRWSAVDHEDRDQLPDYVEFKDKLTQHLLDILYETVPETKGNVEFYELGTPLSEVTYLGSWHGGSYGTKCLTSMFSEENRKWTTTPYTPLANVYLAGSDAFLPAVCGAMYGGCFGASAVMGPARTFKHTLHFLWVFASYLREENPKLSLLESVQMAADRFVNE